MISLAQAIADARDALRRGGVPADEAPGDAEVLARHVLGWDLATLVARRTQPPPPGFDSRYQPLLARRLTREPVSQIVGHREFWGLEFDVSRHVLTPRPETELVVEAALTGRERDRPLVIADVGTGSGCLAVTLAVELRAALVVATDVSEEALIVARRNAERHGVARRIAFVHGDLLPPLTAVDLIVSNPPYLAREDAGGLAPEVRDFEPHVALFGGPDGLEVYTRLLREARGAVAPTGRLVLEVGYDQASAVSALARAAGWQVQRIHTDLQGIERVLALTPSTEEIS